MFCQKQQGRLTKTNFDAYKNKSPTKSQPKAIDTANCANIDTKKTQAATVNKLTYTNTVTKCKQNRGRKKKEKENYLTKKYKKPSKTVTKKVMKKK